MLLALPLKLSPYVRGSTSRDVAKSLPTAAQSGRAHVRLDTLALARRDWGGVGKASASGTYAAWRHASFARKWYAPGSEAAHLEISYMIIQSPFPHGAAWVVCSDLQPGKATGRWT